MGQLLPDRLFWAREEPDADGDEPPSPPRATPAVALKAVSSDARLPRVLPVRSSRGSLSHFADPTDPLGDLRP